MKPVIGVPLRYEYSKKDKPILYMNEYVRRTLQRAGSIVLPIPPLKDVNYMETSGDKFEPLTDEEKEVIENYLNMCNGIFLPGGIKFTPNDRYLLDQAIEKELPILGVCLGMQMMSCYKEDVNIEENKKEVNHNQEDESILLHKVKISKDSKLYEILGVEEFLVNSFHKRYATKNHIYKTVGYSSDGLIEAIEFPTSTFNIGVQWHPEISYSFDDNSKKIIDCFVEAARLFQNSNKKKNTIEIE